MPSNLQPVRQAAALALKQGRLCLVTSRSGKRWVVPKGCCEADRTAGWTALQEAWEEAGLQGTLQREPVGSYLYRKSGKTYHVTVFLMDVTAVAEDWPERLGRRRRWLLPESALERIEDHGLREVIRAAACPDAAGARAGSCLF